MTKTFLSLLLLGIIIGMGTIFLWLKKNKGLEMFKEKSDPALVILTISDLHGQLEPTYMWGNDGKLKQVGGISRIAGHINNIKKLYPEKVLLFGSGDYFIEDFNRGTYFLACGGEAIATLLNALPIDASTIGNHEFDFGADAADKSLQACSFPIIATNLKSSTLSCHILKKLIIEKNGYKIGILGAILPELVTHKAYWFLQGVLAMEPDLYSCMQQTVNELKTVDQVDFVIVLSHIGIDEDRKLAEHVHGIDLICGGHTHTTTKRSCEVIVQKPDQTQTVISHPGDKGRTLGIVKLWPKENGHLTFDCDVFEVDSSIAQDQQIEEKLQSYKKQLPIPKVVVTSTCPIDTTKQAIRKKENGFANFVTDAIRDFFEADIVLINARSISGEELLPLGELTERDMDNLFSFDNDFLICLKATGAQIREALELGVADITTGNPKNLLHVSGLRYTIDPSKLALIPSLNDEGMVTGRKQGGHRVVNVDVEQHDKQFYPLDDSHEYDIVINSMMTDEAFYVAQFYMFKTIKDKHNTGLTEKDVLMKYFEKHATICPVVDGRLKICG